MRAKYVNRTTAIIAIGVLAFAGVIAAILASAHPPDNAPETVMIEVRTTGRAAIRVDGRPSGRAPTILAVPKSYRPIVIEADIGRRTVSRSIVPDENQMVDLSK